MPFQHNVYKLFTVIFVGKLRKKARPQDNQLTNRFQVAVRLFSNRSWMTSKCGKSKKVAHKAQQSVLPMFLPHFDVLCDILLNRRTATWNLFVLYNREFKKSFNDDVIYTSVLQ